MKEISAEKKMERIQMKTLSFSLCFWNLDILERTVAELPESLQGESPDSLTVLVPSVTVTKALTKPT